MKARVVRFSIILATLSIAVLALGVFMQFTQASAASVLSSEPVELKTTPNAVTDDQPGLGYWVVTANLSDANLNVVNTANDMVFGPFLEGQLWRRGGGLLDITMLPNRTTALVSNFGGRAINFVDFSNPISPSWIVSVTVPMYAEDIDLTQDGHYALVTDGAFSSMVAVIDTVAMTTVYTLDLGTKDAQAVEIAPDGTAVVVDYFGGLIHTLLVSDTGSITVTNSYTHLLPSPSGDITIPTPGGPISYYLGWPINLAIAPDGETVIICDAFTTTMSVYQIIAPGVLSHTGYVTGLHGSFQPSAPYEAGPGAQSIAFNEVGDKAYVSINSRIDISGTHLGDQMAILNVDGPGQVSLDIPEAVTIPRHTSGQLFGVDTIVVAGDKAYLGNPAGGGVVTETGALAVVDLVTFDVYTLTIGDIKGETPTGVAVLPINLEMQKSVSAPNAAPGQMITYTLVLTANGPQVYNIHIEDVLPPGLQITGAVTIDPPGAGVPGGAGAPIIAGHITVPANQQVMVRFSVIVGAIPDGQLVNNVAEAFSPELIFPARAEQAFFMDWLKVYLPTVSR